MAMYDVIGAALEVFNTLGYGMAEPIYQESLEKEFALRKMDVEREKPLTAYYKGEPLSKLYYADFYYKDIVVEIKAVDKIISEHHAQLFNYMRITKQCRGILLNFGKPSLHTERYVYVPDQDHFVLLNQSNLSKYVN